MNTEDKQEAILTDQYQGVCRVCGTQSVFVREHRSLREGYRCTACQASLRYRGQAEALLEIHSHPGVSSLAQLAQTETLRQLHIYEPGVSGPYRKLFAPFERYVSSFYWTDVRPGDTRNGVRCEDLEQLTFEPESFDLVITSDIMEHVRHPWVAFAELHRVLKPGGHHVFSIPVQKPMAAKTIYRVDTSGDEDIHLCEPRYHGDGAGGQSLVYVDYGLDLFEQLAGMGFMATVCSPSDGSQEASRLLTFIARKKHIL